MPLDIMQPEATTPSKHLKSGRGSAKPDNQIQEEDKSFLYSKDIILCHHLAYMADGEEQKNFSIRTDE